MLQEIKDFWARVKLWFKNSETILLNRLEVLVGIVLAAIAAMDWSPLWSLFGVGTAFNWTEIGAMSGFLMLRGLAGEILRRRNDPLLVLTHQTAKAEAGLEVDKAKVTEAKKEIQAAVAEATKVTR